MKTSRLILRMLIVMVALSVMLEPPYSAAVATYVTQEGHLAAKSKQSIEEALNIKSKAGNGAVEELVKNRKAFRLKGGQKVYVEGSETGLVGGKIVKMIKIRYEGELKEVWTISDAVRKVE